MNSDPKNLFRKWDQVIHMLQSYHQQRLQQSTKDFENICKSKQMGNYLNALERGWHLKDRLVYNKHNLPAAPEVLRERGGGERESKMLL